MKPWLTLLTGVLIGLLAAGLILLISLPDQGNPIILNPAPTITATAYPKPTQTPPAIYVLIKGEVSQPGEYEIEKDSRLSDLIKLAGGLTNKADTLRVNTVLMVRDGDYFFIPTVDEIIPETARNAPGNNPFGNNTFFEYPIDLNTASQAELESLPGIGPAKANDIIGFREKFGGFNSIDDLLNVPGIGQMTLETIRELIKVE